MFLFLQKKVHSCTCRFGHEGRAEGEFSLPTGILITPNDLVYVSDSYRIQVFQQNGQFIRQFGNGIVQCPGGMTVTSDGHIVVASSSYYADKLSIFTQDGQCVHEVTDIGLNNPSGVAVDSDGLIYIADTKNSRVVVL